MHFPLQICQVQIPQVQILQVQILQERLAGRPNLTDVRRACRNLSQQDELGVNRARVVLNESKAGQARKDRGFSVKTTL
jgi:hypothetical protein